MLGFEHDYRSPLHTHEHLWAHGHSELIFSFGRRYYQKTEAGKTFLPRDFVIGPFKNKLMLFSDGFTGFVAVRFKAMGTLAVFDQADPRIARQHSARGGRFRG